MGLYLPIGSLKTRPGWRRYRDANPVPTSPLDNDLATVPSGPVLHIEPRWVYVIVRSDFPLAIFPIKISLNGHLLEQKSFITDIMGPN